MDPVTLALLIGGGIVSLATAGAVAWGRVRKVSYPRVGAWPKGHILRVGLAEVAIEQRSPLLYAIQQWNVHGYPMIGVFGGDVDVRVIVDPTIDKRSGFDDQEFDVGLTQLQFDADGHTIGSATIRVLPTVREAIVFAHELGHAMGLAHMNVSPSGLVMSPRNAGWDWRGL